MKKVDSPPSVHPFWKNELAHNDISPNSDLITWSVLLYPSVAFRLSVSSIDLDKSEELPSSKIYFR